MNELITSKADLISYLTTKKIASKHPPESVYVSTKLRKQILIGEDQGGFIHKGLHMEFEFTNKGGGVYEAKLKDRSK